MEDRAPNFTRQSEHLLAFRECRVLISDPAYMSWLYYKTVCPAIHCYLEPLTYHDVSAFILQINCLENNSAVIRY